MAGIIDDFIKAAQANPVVQGASQAAQDIATQLFGPAPTGQLFDTSYQPKSPIVKGIEDTVGNAAQAVDQAVSSQKLIPGAPNSPTFGDVAGEVNKAAAGDASPTTDPRYKSVMAAVPLVAGAFEGGAENPEEATDLPPISDELPATGTKFKLGATKGVNEETGLPVGGRLYKTNPPKTATPQVSPEENALNTGTQAYVPPQPENGAQPQQGSYPYQKSPDTLSKVGNDQTQAVRQIRLKAGISGAANEQSVHDTLDRLGFKGSAEQQYSQLQPKMDELNQWVTNDSTLATSPQQVNIDEIKQSFLKNLSDQFRRGEITSDSAQKEINNYINGLYSAARKEGAPYIPGTDLNTGTQTDGRTMIPDALSTQDIYEMKKVANADMSSVYKKIGNNTSLNDTDKVILAGRNALDSVIAKYHPDVDQATEDMSNLYEAAPSLEKARQNPPTTPQFVDIPVIKGLNKPINEGITRLGKSGARMLSNPFVQKGAMIAGGAGLGLAGEAAYNHFNNPKGNVNNPINGSYSSTDNSQNNNGINGSNNQSHSVSSLPQSLQEVKPDQNGAWTVPSPSQITDNSGSILGMSDADYVAQTRALNSEIAAVNEQMAANPYNPGIQTQGANKIAADRQQLDTIKTMHDTSAPLYKGYNFVQTLAGKIANTMQTLNSSSPNVASLSKGIDDLRKQLDPNYGALSEQLGIIQKEFGNGQLDGKTREVLMAQLNTIGQQVAFDYLQEVKTFSGGAATSNSPALTQEQMLNRGTQADPTARYNQDAGNSPASMMSQLPPIQ